MLMTTQHMVSSNDYGCTPVGGRVGKETDLVVKKATIRAETEPPWSYEEKLRAPDYILWDLSGYTKAAQL